VLCNFKRDDVSAAIKVLKFPLLDEEAPACLNGSSVTFLFWCPMDESLGEIVPQNVNYWKW
jgi:hypothetical protein